MSRGLIISPSSSEIAVYGGRGLGSAPVFLAPPVNTVAPVVSGTATIGGELLTTNGTWTGKGLVYTYQWLRNGVAIGGATSFGYVQVALDIGRSITCRVTATNGAGSASADSNAILFTPAGQGGLQLDINPTIGVSLDGSSRVSGILDQSGAGRNYAQTDPTRRWNVSTLNGLTCLQHSGASMAYLTGPSLSALSAAHLFSVVQIDADPPASGNGGIWSFGSDPTATHYTFAGVIYDSFGSTVRKTTGDPGLSLTVPRLYETLSAPGEWTSRIDTALHYTTAANVVGWAATSYIGTDAANITATWQNGKNARILIYNPVRTVSQRADLYAYFKNTYGLSY